jgi:tRNA A-37 threonylcarbamoyl transferase component Bud32
MPAGDLSARRIAPAGFRMEAGASPIQTGDEFESQLRGRLRVASLIWACATLVIGVTAIVTHWEEIHAKPGLLFTEPPLPAVLLLMTLVTVLLTLYLAPARAITLPRLRAVEWIIVAMTAGFFVFNQTLSLSAGTAFDIRDNAMDLGAGLGAPWAAFIVAFGALAPSSARHCAVRTAVFAACAFVPEMLIFPRTIGFGGDAGTYLAIKVITVATMSALAIYGAHRIGVLRRDVKEARQLGQYVLRRTLGSGGMGEVYLAEHQFLRRSCAVKLIRPEQAGDEETLARFEREVRAAARLTHPNTIQIFDYGRAEDGTFYYAMEYLPGISLQDMVDEHGPLPPARAVHVLTQLCGALREAHGYGLVHRDIKPGNVMLCERGGLHDVAKLLDYGLVVTSHSGEKDVKLTQAGMIVGTPAFMSPEQCGGDAEVTAASDIYSLGAVAYFLLTGAAPFAGRSAMQMMAAHLYETPKPLSELHPDITPALSNAIARSLEKSPSGRFAAMEELAEAMHASVSAEDWTPDDARNWWSERATAVA